MGIIGWDPDPSKRRTDDVRKTSQTVKRYPPKFKFQVMLEVLRGTKTMGQMARSYGVHPITIIHWKKEFMEKGPEVFGQRTTIHEYEKKVRELEQLIGHIIIIERISFSATLVRRVSTRKFSLLPLEELELWQRYVDGESASEPASIKTILSIPPHAPALMGIKVSGDWLLIITGNRNWKKGENEALVYRLPSLKYEGSFFIPFPNQLKTNWGDEYNHYTIQNLIEKEDGNYFSYEIYEIEEK